MRFDELGRELPDPTPIEVPLGMRRPETIQQMMARLVSSEISRSAEKAGFESHKDAFDFDVDDDDELPFTGHELLAMKPEYTDEQGGDADDDSGDGEDGEDESGRSESDSRRNNRSRQSEDESRESDRDSSEHDRRRTANGNRGRESRDSRSEDDRRSRRGSSRREELDE